MFGVLGWIIFGFVVGAIAKLVMPGKDHFAVLALAVTLLSGLFFRRVVLLLRGLA
jgi:uncharacterized membrane protein YeaQ/YmgE (transglycosylase-associated protein family)